MKILSFAFSFLLLFCLTTSVTATAINTETVTTKSPEPPNLILGGDSGLQESEPDIPPTEEQEPAVGADQVSTYQQLEAWLEEHKDTGGTVEVVDDLKIITPEGRTIISIWGDNSMKGECIIDMGEHNIELEGQNATAIVYLLGNITLRGEGTTAPLVHLKNFSQFSCSAKARIETTGDVSTAILVEGKSNFISYVPNAGQSMFTIATYGNDSTGLVVNDRSCKISHLNLESHGQRSIGLKTIGGTLNNSTLTATNEGSAAIETSGDLEIFYTSIRGVHGAESIRSNGEVSIKADVSLLEPTVPNAYEIQRQAQEQPAIVNKTQMHWVAPGQTILPHLLPKTVTYLLHDMNGQEPDIRLALSLLWDIEELDTSQPGGPYTILGIPDLIPGIDFGATAFPPQYQIEVLEPQPPNIVGVSYDDDGALLELEYPPEGCSSGTIWLSNSPTGPWQAYGEEGNISLYTHRKIIPITDLEPGQVYYAKIEFLDGLTPGETQVVKLLFSDSISVGDKEPDVDGKRGGSGNFISNSQSITAKQTNILTKSQLQTLVAAQEPYHIFITDAGKFALPQVALTQLAASTKSSIILQLQKTSSDTYQVSLLQDNVTQTSLKGGHYLLLLPYSPPTGVSGEYFICTDGEDKVLPFSYYDSRNRRMNVGSNTFGVIKIRQAAAQKFSDTQNHWAKKAIDFASRRGIISGFDDGTFRPNQTMTKSQFLKMLGVLTGEKRSVQPSANINREEMAIVIYHFALTAGYPLPEAQTVPYRDCAHLSATGKKAVATLTAAGILQGVESNVFAPTDNLTRAQGVQVLHNLICYSYLQ